MRTSWISSIAAASAATLMFASLGAAQQEHRQLGKHLHGQGTLSIAIEGNRVDMELEVAGADIVGFEHAATSKADKEAIARAKAVLARPLSLFAVPDGAQCRVGAANVAAKGLSAHDHGGKTSHHDSHGDEGHSEFHAAYTLHCAVPQALTHISLKYFDQFKRAHGLDVRIITARGQKKFKITRASPRLSLSGLL